MELPQKDTRQAKTLTIDIAYNTASNHAYNIGLALKMFLQASRGSTRGSND